MFVSLKNGCVVFPKHYPNNRNVVCVYHGSLLLRHANRESQVGEVRCDGVDGECAWGGWTSSTLGDGVELQINLPKHMIREWE